MNATASNNSVLLALRIIEQFEIVLAKLQHTH